MADEKPMSSVSETVPPKANPLAAPATAHTATLQLKPGLRLPPKPGLASGIKLPPKTGATVSGLKPGVRIPTQPGLKPGIKLPTQSALKPGVKLPARPMIRKPGATLAAPSPLATKPPAAASVAAKPTPAPAPVASVAPAASAAPVTPAPTTVAAAPTPAPTPVPAAELPKPLEALKAVTQNLKSITAPIPQQAILRKTGIIADAEMTEAQKQAAKSKTARISLSDAMGVAPVKNDALPMKTIRIKRPVDIPGATNAPTPAPTATAVKPLAPATEPAKDVDTQAETKVPAPSGAATTFTQRKTLKISRPGGVVRPSGKFGVKKPTAAPTAKPAGEAPAATGAEVADIPDLPPVSAAAPKPVSNAAVVPDVPKGVATLGVVIQIAACLAMAFLGWLLYQNAELPLYCGGLGM